MKDQTAEHISGLMAREETAQHFTDDAWLFGSHPINEVHGHHAIGQVYAELFQAIPDLERREIMFLGGENLPDDRVETPRPGQLVATSGVYQGHFTSNLHGIPANGKLVTLRFCEVYELDEASGKIKQLWALWDFLDLMGQAGVWPLPPSLGVEGMWQAPTDAHGLRHSVNDAVAGKQAMVQVLGMHHALSVFDGKDLDSMPHADYWTQHFMWYGPGGIGSTRGLTGFRAHHQIPFLVAFPDRAGSGHYMRIGDGSFAVTGGWPSVTATHTGEFLGIGPTGRPIGMRVMDFYRVADDGLIAENWVPIDIIHIALQMGVDLFARVRHLSGNPRITL